MTPSDIAEAWAERAAIMEFDGGLERTEAEAWAWARMREVHGPEACVRAQEIVALNAELLAF